MKSHLMTNLLKKITLLTLLPFLFACSSTKGWVYKSNSYESNVTEDSKFKRKTIAVLPFTDQRPAENTNSSLLYLIPLMPFGYQDLNTPETIPVHLNSGLWANYSPKDDFAKAMVEELNNANLFKDTTFSYSAKDSDYSIKGEIISTFYNGKILSYGLSVYGTFLWYVGLPATTVSNNLEVKLSLINSKTKEVVFSKTYKANEYSAVGWIYKLPNDFQYPEMLKQVYKEFVNDMIKS